jgi:hypothetical protein
MSQYRALLLRNGLLAGCSFAAIVLLAIFYSTVSGAVDRAARQRLAAADSGVVTTQAAASRARATTSAAIAVPARATRSVALFARSGN